MEPDGAEWWSVLWRSGALAMGVLGPARTYLAVNPQLCHLFGADAATITAWSYEQVGHPLDLDAELDALVRLGEGAGTVVYHRRFRTAAGGEFAAEVRLCAGAHEQVMQLVTPAGKPVTAGAEQLGQRLEQVGAALSHDALEAVRQVSVQAGLMAERDAQRLDERAQRTLGSIERAALKAGRQLRGLALFARIGTPRIDPAPVALRPLVDAAWRAQAGVPGDAAVTIAVPDDARWRCDPQQVQVALAALLANAIAFRAPDRPLVLGVTVVLDAQRCAISVQDNGLGINPADQPRLFKVFATIGSPLGVGLGLATVRAVALGHGGEARLESLPGQGTRVVFTLGA